MLLLHMPELPSAFGDLCWDEERQDLSQLCTGTLGPGCCSGAADRTIHAH